MTPHPDSAGHEPPAQPGANALLAAVRRILRPLVGLLIRKGVTFPHMVDLLRGLYVDVAAHDLLPDPKSRTDSRISLMTGVHRKEIRRQRPLQFREPGEPAVVTIATQVVAHWLVLARNGTLPPLPRIAENPASDSFERLVSKVTTDIRPRALLDDWIDQGLVRLDDTDRVHLNIAAFLPKPGSDQQAYFLGRNLGDHMAAGTANMLADGPAPNLDRSAHYDRLSPETARRIEAAMRMRAELALQDINAMALAEIARDAVPAEAAAAERARVNIGIYVYRDDTGRDDIA